MADDDFPYLCSDRDRHGNIRWYFRPPGTSRKLRIREERGTEAFGVAYWGFRNGRLPDPKPTPQWVQPGSFEWIVRLYWASPEFSKLDVEHTQATRRRVLMHLIDAVGDRPAIIPTQTIRDGVRSRSYGAAKNFLQSLRGLYRFAIDAGHLPQDPTVGIRLARPRTDGFHTWTAADCAAFEAHWPVGSKQRLAYALGLYTAQRGSDVVRLGRVFEKGGRLRFRQWKNRNDKAVWIDIPIVQPLREVLDATSSPGLTYLMTEYDRPYTADGIRTAFRIWCDAAGLKHCSFHGLRKAAATRMAEAGCTPHQIMAVLGHSTHQQAATYTAKVDRAGLADRGLERLFGEQNVPPPKLGGTETAEKS